MATPTELDITLDNPEWNRVRRNLIGNAAKSLDAIQSLMEGGNFIQAHRSLVRVKESLTAMRCKHCSARLNSTSDIKCEHCIPH